MKPFSVGYETINELQAATSLAKRLNLPLDNETSNQLFVTEKAIVLKIENFASLQADFSIASWKKRREAGKKQGLVRACKPSSSLRVLDLTAGWGKDAAILASFGAEVVMLERNAIMGVLLEDALNRQDQESRNQLKLHLLAVDAFDFLVRLEKDDEYFDVIYLDPMHPPRSKSALVKKEMQVLHEFISADEKTLDLLNLARKRAKKRVVLKWPHNQPCLIKPDFSVDGKTIRFDVYICHS